MHLKLGFILRQQNELMRSITLLFCVLTLLLTAFPTFAQEISPEIKKNVVQNYKVNLSDYLTFGTDCSLKPKGDANCDKIINQFDLSIWEIEFNAPDKQTLRAHSLSPRRSDFNADGVINLLDFGIWRNTFYPQQTTKANSFFEFLSSIFNLQSLISNIYAQEPLPNTQPLDSSLAFVSGSGDSLVINSNTNGNTQQVSFDLNGNPASSQLFSTNGDQLAGVSFLESGTTVINTQEDGIQIQINKTVSGAVIEFFRNPDGSLIAIKSWPTEASYSAGEPPLSVTVPGQGNIRNVFNIQPNGDSILEKSDSLGNVLSRNQIRSNGTLVTENFQNKTLTQSNSQIGFTTLTLDNNLGGKSDYMFYQGQLYAVVQTKSQNEFYIAKPLDLTGDYWSFESNINGAKSEKTVSNPITELKSNTPDPKQLISYINYYKTLSTNSNNINFSDGFPATARGLTPQIQKANNILTISSAQAPAVLGIIKEARAQLAETKVVTTDVTTINKETPFQAVSYTFSIVDTKTNQSIGNYSITIPDTPIKSADGNSIDYGNIRGTGFPVDGKGLTQAQRLQALEVFSQDTLAAADFAQFGITTGTTQGPGPAAPPPAALPAGTVDLTAASFLNSITPEMRQGAADAATNATGDPAVKAAAAFQGALSKGASADQASVLAADTYMTAAIKDQSGKPDYDFQGKNLFQEAQKVGLDPTATANRGLQVINEQRAAQSAAPLSAPTNLQPFTPLAGTGGVPGTSGPATAPAAAVAAAATGVTTPFTMGNLSGMSVTTTNAQGQTIITATLTGGPNGMTTFTQNLSTLNTTFQDSRGIFSANAGVLTSAAFSNVERFGSPTGTIYAVNAAGTAVVAIGSLTELNPVTGRALEGHGRSLTTAESRGLGAFNAQRDETAMAGGASQGHLGSTCFLAGTLISTPSGARAIETFKPGDKVYSYNEKTGEKQVSDFKELDINFVDEYLIINGKIRTTVYHPFYIVILDSIQDPDKSAWIPYQVRDDRNTSGMTLKTIRADELKSGDILQDEQGNYIPVSSIEKIPASKTTVYNLMNVLPNNNFFAEGILVHNYDWEPPDWDAPFDQTGASPDDPGTTYEAADRPDMVQGPDGPEPAQPDFTDSPSFGDPGISQGDFGGSTDGSGKGQDSGPTGDFNQPDNPGSDPGTQVDSGGNFGGEAGSGNE